MSLSTSMPPRIKGSQSQRCISTMCGRCFRGRCAEELAPNFVTSAKGWIEGRGFILCKDDITAKFIEKVLMTLAVKEKDSGTITSFKE